ncbi:MAG TPA: hypothetical protein VNJ31_11145 [Methyloceanibacter sp.]|nr:hypothetical protein [Methyloceanibacter sp.]
MADRYVDLAETARFQGREGFWGTFSREDEEPGGAGRVKLGLLAGRTYQFWLTFPTENGATNDRLALRIVDAHGNLVASGSAPNTNELGCILQFSPVLTGAYFVEVGGGCPAVTPSPMPSKEPPRSGSD